jgi:hypothetical protein
VKLYESEFLKNGGDATWLKGLKYVPKKLHNLHTINKILAHQPWTVNSDNMKVCLLCTVQYITVQYRYSAVQYRYSAVQVQCSTGTVQYIAIA